jgi:hypothetical protein
MKVIIDQNGFPQLVPHQDPKSLTAAERVMAVVFALPPVAPIGEPSFAAFYKTLDATQRAALKARAVPQRQKRWDFYQQFRAVSGDISIDPKNILDAASIRRSFDDSADVTYGQFDGMVTLIDGRRFVVSGCELLTVTEFEWLAGVSLEEYLNRLLASVDELHHLRRVATARAPISIDLALASSQGIESCVVAPVTRSQVPAFAFHRGKTVLSAEIHQP